jgi:hypothetical protein
MTTATTVNLDGSWGWLADPGLIAGQNGSLAQVPRKGVRQVRVPGIWNIKIPDYHGPAVYYRTIRIPRGWAGCRLFLVFEGCNYLARVCIDGVEIGSHEGGYVGFELEMTRHARPGADQLLAVHVIHSPPKQEVAQTHLEDVASSKELWYYSYAGLWGSVRIESRPKVFVQDLFAMPSLAGKHVDVVMALNGSRRPAGEWILRDGRGRRVDGGACALKWRINLRSPRPWSPDDPHLYTLEVTLPNGFRKSIRFGMRDIAVKRDGFLLNGKPVHVKGVLLQPNYPQTLVNAPDREFVRKELRRIRDGGFNLVRAHLKPMLPYALDLADEMGLLVYEEPALGWIRKGPELVRRACAEVGGMIARDRNHPCIICWGVVNENDSTYKAIRSSVDRLIHRLDPTRPAIGNSGAYAVVPLGGWIGETRIKLPRTTAQVDFEDAHMYISAPLKPAAWDFLRLAGDPARMPLLSEFTMQKPGAGDPWRSRLRRTRPRIFLSEYGCGGLMDFRQAVRRYTVKSCQDGRQYAEFAASLERDLRRRGLWKELGTMSGLLRQVNRIQAEGDRKQTEAVRINPLVTGYVITQFNDVAWECCAGLTDVWRDPKPAYHAMRKANQPLIGVVRPSAINLVEGAPVGAQAWVVTDGGGGPFEVEVALVAPNGRVLCRSLAAVRGRSNIRPAGVHRLGLVGPAGTYTIRCRVMSGGRRLYEGAEELFVFPAVRDAGASGGWDVVRASEELTAAQWKQIFARVRAGGRLLLTGVTPAVAKLFEAHRLLPWKFKCTVGHSTFNGQFHYLHRVPELAGLPADRIAAAPYAGIIPDWTLNEIPGARILGGSFTVSIFREPGDEIRQLGSMNWFADIIDLPLGRGTLRICQYDIWKDDPVARILRRGLAS